MVYNGKPYLKNGFGATPIVGNPFISTVSMVYKPRNITGAAAPCKYGSMGGEWAEASLKKVLHRGDCSITNCESASRTNVGMKQYTARLCRIGRIQSGWGWQIQNSGLNHLGTSGEETWKHHGHKRGEPQWSARNCGDLEIRMYAGAGFSENNGQGSTTFTGDCAVWSGFSLQK